MTIQFTMFGEPKLLRLADDQTPIYRICHLGAQSCSYQELLAVLLGGKSQLEVAETITSRWKTPLELLGAPLPELGNINGIGPTKAARIKAAFELGRLVSVTTPGERPTIHSPADAAALVQYEMSVLGAGRTPHAHPGHPQHRHRHQDHLQRFAQFIPGAGR